MLQRILAYEIQIKENLININIQFFLKNQMIEDGPILTYLLSVLCFIFASITNNS